MPDKGLYCRRKQWQRLEPDRLPLCPHQQPRFSKPKVLAPPDPMLIGNHCLRHGRGSAKRHLGRRSEVPPLVVNTGRFCHRDRRIRIGSLASHVPSALLA